MISRRWWAAYAAALVASTLLGLAGAWGGNVAFFAGALVILASVGFIGVGGDRRFRIVRNIMGVPVTKEVVDPAKRRVQISTGIKVFLLGLALWAPLLVLALL